MEIRARYVQMGAFTLAVIAAGFVFVYWLNNVGGLRERVQYRVVFESPVSGLLSGSAVLFNGIRVGEVVDLRLAADDPRQVNATIAVDRDTPVRADTKAGIDFQGLTGSPVISLVGGTSAQPLAASKGALPALAADPLAGQSMTQAARDVLRRVDGVVEENAKPLRETIANLSTFSGVLARNSDRLDAILAGLERMTGGAAAKARVGVYDLKAPATLPAADKADVQLVIPEPTVLIAFDSDKIMVRAASGAATAMADAQWSDNLPKLVQTKIIQVFENANLFAGVTRPVEGAAKDFQLLIDIRSFQIVTSPATAAEVELAGKVLDSGGRIVDTAVFRATAAVESAEAGPAVAGFDRAFGTAAADLVAWAGRAIGARLQPAVGSKGTARKRANGG